MTTMKTTHVEITLVDATRGRIFSKFTEEIPKGETAGSIYRTYRKEYGKCISKVYIDKDDGKTVCVGWVFEKRMGYGDCKGNYLREAWVSVIELTPERHNLVELEDA